MAQEHLAPTGTLVFRQIPATVSAPLFVLVVSATLWLREASDLLRFDTNGKRVRA